MQILPPLGLAVLVALAAIPDDPVKDLEKDLKSDDFAVRLAAVESLASGEHEDAEKLLVRALGDDDWEIVQRAAAALGTVGTPKRALDPLVGLALDGPVRRVRRVAAESLERLAPAEAFDELSKKAPSGDQGVAACAAMAIVARGLETRAGSRALEKALKSKEDRHRAVAAKALVVATEASEARGELLAELLAHEDLGVRAAALEGIAMRPQTDDLATLLGQLGTPQLNDVLARRARAAVLALVHSVEPTERSALLGEVAGRLAALRDAGAAAQIARLVGELAEPRPTTPIDVDPEASESDSESEPVPGPIAPADALPHLAKALAHGEEDVRAAALRSLQRLGTADAVAKAMPVGVSDSSARVRLAAVLVVARAGDVTDDATREWMQVRASEDRDARVREEAATALGVDGLERATATLVQCLGDSDWGVSVCAAVSLGKIAEPGGVEPLQRLYASSDDWRRRGGAVAGLGRISQKSAVPSLIDALGDAEPLVARTAYEYLLEIAGRRMERDAAVWKAWWAENEKRVTLVDPVEATERRKRYGYVRTAAELYKGLDVIVLQSDGDHIQEVLSDLELEHRLTQPSKVREAETHNRGVFVSNCTGQIGEDDVARLQWFVRAGGYLFGSCWAVEETIARVYPGVVRRLPTLSEVLDNVRASAAQPDSRYLRGVFDGDVEPIYALQGAYLVDVLAPERVEVLIDSPECAQRWGGGNLCAWFTVGHGVILDSVNHFDVQGLELANSLRKPEERMAYAVDHMGLTYEKLRETREAKYWKSKTDAAQEVRDLSVFRLVSNFVRDKRISGD